MILVQELVDVDYGGERSADRPGDHVFQWIVERLVALRLKRFVDRRRRSLRDLWRTIFFASWHHLGSNLADAFCHKFFGLFGLSNNNTNNNNNNNKQVIITI